MKAEAAPDRGPEPGPDEEEPSMPMRARDLLPEKHKCDLCGARYTEGSFVSIRGRFYNLCGPCAASQRRKSRRKEEPTDWRMILKVLALLLVSIGILVWSFLNLR